MADLSDVEATLVGIITGAAYPNGTTEPSALSGAVPVKVGRGWPLKDALQADLAAGVANVSVFSQPGAERNTTRFSRAWRQLTAADPTITLTLTDTTVSLGGSVSPPQNIAVITAGVAYVYAIQAGDSLSTIASALAALVPGASSTGPVLTAPNAAELNAHVGGQGSMIRELSRQERLWMISIWCQTPTQRDVVAPFVDTALKGLGLANEREFIALPDGSFGRLLYVRSAVIDRDELVGSYRRDLIYSVEYPTTETQGVPQIVTVQVELDACGSEIATFSQ
jgi:hypothetical protein